MNDTILQKIHFEHLKVKYKIGSTRNFTFDIFLYLVKTMKLKELSEWHKNKDKRTAVIEYLLNKDPKRYKWAKSYLN